MGELDEAMCEAIALGERAGKQGDVPVGAVVLDERGTVIGRGRNRREAGHDPLAHAEIEAMREAAQARGDWNLADCTLVVTLEPCPMCAGACIQTHIGRIVFGAWDAKLGACGSIWDIPRDPHVGHVPQVVGEGSLATKPTYEYVQLFSGQSSDGPPRLRQSQVRRPRPFGRATHTIRSMEQKDVLKALQRDHAAELKLAAKRLKGTARHTEIIPSRTLSELTGHEILLKPENLQVTGSFKIRGAYNKIASLSEEQIARGIVTASAGNHAQGVAYAARERHAKATICMPQITPPLKVDATKAYGADVVLYGDVFDEAAAHAAELASTQGMIYVPPFDDYEVICGQGTIGLEILEDVPNVTDVVVPLGGGGLGAGVALAIKTFKPEARVIGAIPEGSPAWKNSFAAGRVTEADQVVTSAEGVAVKHPGDLPFALLNEFMDDLVTVTERDINEMILLMLEKHKLVIEAAGAVSLAALEHLNLRSRKFASATGPHVVVPIMSGGNIDTVTMGAVIQKGMIARGRIMNFEVELPDTPGQLVKVAQLLARERANVIALDHDQFKASGHYTNAVSLGVTVETNGPDHIDHILMALKEAGFQPKRIY